MRCPNCGGKLYVKDMRQIDGHIRRVRGCDSCGHRYMTEERFLKEWVRDENGRRRIEGDKGI